MKATKFFILILFFEFIFINLNAQISGGNTVSSFVCSNRKVYVWGNNTTTSGTGLLGTGGTAVLYSTPQPVTFTGGVDISQVSSGSGSHFLALDCTGNAWAWGNNSFGQVGNGTALGQAGFVSSPTRVLALAEVDASYKDASNQLINVFKVYAGNNSSFAILNNGDLVSWGQNGKGFDVVGYDDGYGKLGNGVLPGAGTTSNQTAAGYVKVPGGAKLTGVIQVFEGDNCAYALCDPDGDGIGTVYSWGDGKNGMLGRDALGTKNPKSSLEVKDSWARPVRYTDGTIMDNITQIQAGDVFGAALDVNGYIWTWGNGSWNNATGNTTVNYSGSDPRRVLKGTTTGNSNDGTYLLAKMIGAGQGFGMAVTIDNKPVAWGGGGYIDGGGFSGGSGTTGPEYITYAGTSVHNDVISIYRGDTWGFYGRADGTMWAWGRNAEGQLGLGTTSNEVLQATKINPPSGCGFLDIAPSVNLTPKSTTICASSFTNITLDAGFIVSAGISGSYKIEWFKDGVSVSVGTVLAKGITYVATAPGTYRVVITYIGSNAGCSPYDPVEAIMTFSTYPASYTIPTTLTYCNDSAVVKVKSTLPTNAKYNWYNTASSTAVIGSSIGNYPIRIPIAGATLGAGTDKILYVEESSYASGTILKKSEGCATSWFTGDLNLNVGANDIDQTFATGYTLYEPVTISELSFMYRSSILSVGTSGTATITFSIFGSKLQNGGLVADDTKILGTLVAYYTRTRGATEAMDLDIQLTAIGNVLLQPGTYFIGPSSYASTGNLTSPKLGRGNCALSTGIVDDVNGTIIKQNIGVCGYGNPNQASTGFVFDIKFSTVQHFCDRLPVTLKIGCDCVLPSEITITSTDTDLTLCPGESTILSSNSQLNSIDYDFTWYKGDNVTGTVVFSTTANIAKSFYTVTNANSGLYTLLVRDKIHPTNEMCYKKASVTVSTAEYPTVTISGGGTFELNQLAVPISIGFTGTAPFSVTYNPNAIIKTGLTSNLYQVPLPTNVGTYIYSIVSFSDKYCTGVTPANTATLTLTAPVVVPISGITLPATLDLYVGNTATLSPAITPANATDKTVTWTTSNSSIATVNPNGVVTAISVGNAVITATANDGSAKSASCTVTVLQTPVVNVTGITVTPTAVNLAIGQTATAVATISPTNATNKSVTWSSSNTAVATVSSGVISGVSAGTATITVTSADNPSITATIIVTVTDIQVTSVTVTPSIVNMKIEETAVLTATVLPSNAPQSLVWTSSNTVIATVNANGVVTGISVGSTTIKATSSSNATIFGTVTVNVSANLITSIVLDRTTLTLTNTGAPAQLVPTILPVNATNKIVTWASSNAAVATVSASGVVTPVGVGTSIITATAADGSGITASCTVTVTTGLDLYVTSITVNPTTLTIPVGSNATITKDVMPANASNPSVTWSSTNPAVAVINPNGVLTAVAPGTTTIKATANDGSAVFGSCAVTVISNSNTTIAVYPTQANLKVSETVTLQTVVTPVGANDIITFTSSNPSVAVVNANGVVTATGIGTAIITAKLVGANVTATSVITVTPQLVTEISIVPQSATLDIQGVIGLTAIVFPVTATNKAIFWTSSNPSVATVSQTGLVTAIAEGTANIIANSADGSGKIATSVITVNPAPVVCNQIQVFSNITNVNCSGAKTGEIELLVSGGVEPYTYKWSNTGTESTILGVQAGTYSVTITDDEGCSVVKVYEVTQPDALELTPTIVSPQCGNSDGSISIQVTGGTSPYTYAWSDASITNAITAKEAGLYTVTVTDKKGCELAESFELSNDGAPQITVESVVPTNCNASTGGIYISVTGGTEPYAYSWNNGITDKDVLNVSPGVYTVTVTDDNGCKSIASAEVESSSILEPSVALVTVSVDNGKNQIVWQKETTDLIDFYTIYRENNVAGQYDLLGTVPYADKSVFEDPTANSQVRAWRYKISATDVCGNESVLSTEHKTLHLQKNLGLGNVVNLDWTGYEGIYYATYNIYRINSSNVEELIDQVPSSISNYTDLTPPANVKSYYVAIVLPNEIDLDDITLLKLESGPFTLALSNIAEVQTGISEVENGVKVYPTITNTVVNVDVNSIKQVNVSLLSSSGEVLFTKKMKDKTIQIPVNQYSKGIYVIKVEFDNEVVQKQILIK
jgi:uncharacterized protein YjdB/alpha-tubulin suppressor-like RCC1 family protein